MLFHTGIGSCQYRECSLMIEFINCKKKNSDIFFVQNRDNKLKSKQYHTVIKVSKSNKKIIETDVKSKPLTHLHLRSLPWLYPGYIWQYCYVSKCFTHIFFEGPSWSWLYGSWIRTIYAISAYHHKRCEFEPRLWRGALDTTLCDKNLLVTCSRSVVFSGYSGFHRQ